MSSKLTEIGFKHISDTIDESIKVVSDAKDGKVLAFPTKWRKLNRRLLGGLRKSKLYVVSGRPGSGKSAFSNQMIFDLLDNNKEENLIVLYWNFEMPSYQQILRVSSKIVKKEMSELLSIDVSLADQDFINFTKAVAEYKDYPVYFHDIPKSIAYIKKINEALHEEDEDRTIINVYDHTRLVKGSKERSELDRLVELSHTCVEMQSQYGVINVLLSQLNRNIEREERRFQQFQPMLSDLFGSDSIGQDAEVVMMINRPYDLYGIMESYNGQDPRGLLALHIEKNREGEIGMIPFEADMRRFNITER